MRRSEEEIRKMIKTYLRYKYCPFHKIPTLHMFDKSVVKEALKWVLKEEK
jgi:hypothetical protein